MFYRGAKKIHLPFRKNSFFKKIIFSVLIFWTFFGLPLNAGEINASYSLENAKKYTHSPVDNTYYLAFRDVPGLIEKYVKGKKAIDFGCGTGRSTRFLRDLGFETLGVDNSKEMIEQATRVDNKNHYLLLKDSIPVLDDSYDLVFCCLVLCTIPTKSEMLAVLKEVNRCLKKDGIAIIVTASDIFYTNQWLSYNVNYKENDDLKSGDTAKLFLKDLDIELTNYYWTHKDYTELAKLASLEIIDTLLPLGKNDEKQHWVSETTRPPYVIYTMKKN